MIMSILTYFLLLIVIVIAVLFGTILSIICSEEMKNLKTLLTYIYTIFIFLASLCCVYLIAQKYFLKLNVLNVNTTLFVLTTFLYISVVIYSSVHENVLRAKLKKYF